MMTATKQYRSEEEIGQEVCRIYELLAGARGNFNSHCTEIAERIWPNHSRLFTSGGKNLTQGEKRNQELYDVTGANSLDRFASILDSLLTPANATWQHMVPVDPYLMKDRQARLWYEEFTRNLFQLRYAPQSNFQSQNQMVYKSLGAYGNGTIYPDLWKDLRGKPAGIRYRNIHLSEIYFDVNHQGIIDTSYRYFDLTPKQAIDMFGKEKLPAQILSALVNSPNQKFYFIHCVKPREDYDPDRKDIKGMPFVSYYVAECEKKLIEEMGYNTFPYPTARYEQVPGEIYARSPAMLVLPALKTLNAMKRTVLTQGHRAAEPVLLTFDDGIVDSFSVRPNAVNAGGVNADGRPLVHALPSGNIAICKELMDDERNDIKDPFLVPLFAVLTENPTMTAYEVQERVKEKTMLLAPTIGRQYADYHSPMTDREVDLMAQLGKIPQPIPPAVLEAGAEYSARYESPMTRSQRAEEASGGLRLLDSIIQISTQTQDSSPLDHFELDEMIPDLADIQGVPARWMKSSEDIAKIREGRAQAAQQEQMNRAAPGAAAIIKSTATAQKVANEG